MLTVEYNLRFRVYLAASQQEAKEGLLLCHSERATISRLSLYFLSRKRKRYTQSMVRSFLVWFFFIAPKEINPTRLPSLGSTDNACCKVPPASGVCVSFRCFQTHLTMVGSFYCCHLKRAVCSGLFQLIHPFGRCYCEGFTAYRYRTPYTHGRVSRHRMT